jgi:hypothetical protein
MTYKVPPPVCLGTPSRRGRRHGGHAAPVRFASARRSPARPQNRRFESRYGRLSAHVQKVVERYLRCGIPDYGFARIKCADCGRELLLPFSCKCRSFCPSCQKRRQLEFAEFCASEVFAPVPHRQVVLSIPKRIRLHFFRKRSPPSRHSATSRISPPTST